MKTAGKRRFSAELRVKRGLLLRSPSGFLAV